MKRHKLTRLVAVQTYEMDLIEWPEGTTVWTTGRSDPDENIETVPYPGSEFFVWLRPSDLRLTENA